MRVREVKVALLAKRARIEEHLNKLEAERGALAKQYTDISDMLAMLEAPAAKPRKPRAQKAPAPPADPLNPPDADDGK